MSEKYDIKRVSDLTLDFAKQITRSQHGFVSTIDPKTLDNVGHTLTKMFGDQCKVTDQRVAFPIDEGGRYNALWGHVLNTKESFLTNHPNKHPEYKGLPEGHVPLHNYLAVPAKIVDKMFGMIALANSADDYYAS